MPKSKCCESPSLAYVREEPTADGGKRQYYTCLVCKRSVIVTRNKDGDETSRQAV